jgi:hypothetical protein
MPAGSASSGAILSPCSDIASPLAPDP